MELKSMYVEDVVRRSGVNQDGRQWKNATIVVRETNPVPYPDRFSVIFFTDQCDKVSGIGSGAVVDVVASARISEWQRKDGSKGFSTELVGYDVICKN